MSKGRLRIEGESVDTLGSKQLDGDQKQQDEIFDGAGNKITIQRIGTKSEKERKRELKDLEKKMKDAKDPRKKETLTEEEQWELADKIAELKEMEKQDGYF